MISPNVELTSMRSGNSESEDVLAVSSNVLSGAEVLQAEQRHDFV